jgi:uncharacterized protein
MPHPHPREDVRVPTSIQQWDTFTFLHWPIEPAAVQERLPAGLEVDTFDGQAWVGVTPFRMRGARVPFLPAVPGLSTFPETNVRTYVRGPAGDGLWFLTLHAASRPFVLALRRLGLPYVHAKMGIETRDEQVRYFGAARHVSPDIPATGALDCTVEIGRTYAEGEAGDLEHFLTARWRAYTAVAGRLAVTPAHHEQWPLRHGAVRAWSATILDALRLPVRDVPPLVHCSPGVDVRIGLPSIVRGATRS